MRCKRNQIKSICRDAPASTIRNTVFIVCGCRAVEFCILSDKKCTTAAKFCQFKEPGADNSIWGAAAGVAVYDRGPHEQNGEIPGKSGLAEALGNGRGRNDMLSSKAYGADNAVAYVRQKGIDEIRYPELVLELARKQKEIRRADVITLLHISVPKAYRLLRRLREEGKLALHDKGAGAYDTMREEK